ncbi:uncharacterized protein LOC62_02G001934 [Vanrija pseudolonga]|uniref:Uncharacterized protein n=1 Tax=Vanrija pseudolonga TaxID=143232 RepID=A0AAF0Y1P1_9TREE|nr:hypothetical protein LOC62_02G001934 [Vanrija pseudolonga]
MSALVSPAGASNPSHQARLLKRVKKVFSPKKAQNQQAETTSYTQEPQPLPTPTAATPTHEHTQDGEEGCAVCEDFGLTGCRNPFVPLPSSVTASSSAATLVAAPAPVPTAPTPAPSTSSASSRPRPVSGPVPTHNDYFGGMGYGEFLRQACLDDLAAKATGQTKTVNMLTRLQHDSADESTSDPDSSSETLANWVAAATQLDEGPHADSRSWNRQAVYVPRQTRGLPQAQGAEAGPVEVLADENDETAPVEQQPARVDTPASSDGSIHGTGASAPQMARHNPNVFGFDVPQRARATNRWGFHAGSPAMTAPPSLYGGPSESQSPIPNTATGERETGSSLDISSLSRALESIRDLNGLHEDPSPSTIRQIGFPTRRDHEDEDDSATGPAVLADDGSEANTDVSSPLLESGPRGRPVWNNPASRITDYAGSEGEDETEGFQGTGFVAPFARAPAHRDTFGAPSPASSYPTYNEAGRDTPKSEHFDPVAYEQADELDDEGFPAYDASQYEPTPHRDFENQTPVAGSSTQRGTAQYAETERLSLNTSQRSQTSQQSKSDAKVKAPEGKGKRKQSTPANKDKDLPPSPVEPTPTPTAQPAPAPQTANTSGKPPKTPVHHPPQRPGQSDADYYKEYILRENGRGAFYRQVSGLHTDPAHQLHNEGLSTMMPILEHDFQAYPARPPPHVRLPVQHQRPQQLGTQGFPPSLARPRRLQPHQRQTSQAEVPYQVVLAQAQAAQQAAREQEEAEQQGGEQGAMGGRGRRNWKQVQKQPPT